MELTVENTQVVNYDGPECAFEVVGDTELEFAETRGYMIYRD